MPRAAGQVTDSAERQHLRAVLAGGYMPNRFSLRADQIGFRPQVAVGVDLQLDAAVAKDSLGHNRDHVQAIDFRRDDERRGLVVGICRSGTDRGDKTAGAAHDAAVPLAPAFKERNYRLATRHGAIKKYVRVEPYQLSVTIAIAVACTGAPRLYVTQDRAGVASDGIVVRHDSCPSPRPGWRHERGPAWPGHGAHVSRWHHGSR